MENSMFELQKLDCNCNDCIFMIRDFETKQKHLVIAEKNELIAHKKQAKKARNRAYELLYGESNYDGYNQLIKESKKPFVFAKKDYPIGYGKCDKFKKEVSFIPYQIQIETQNCFQHRKEKMIQ